MELLSADYSDEELLALIHWHTVDIFVGVAGTMLCVPTLFVFCSSKKFFRNNRLLALLAFGDLMTCLGILTMGFIRKNMYMDAMETGRVPIENTWSCAEKPFVFFRLLGSLIPPFIVFWISVERFLAVFVPTVYRNHVSKHSGVPPLVITIYSVVAVCIAYVIAWLKRDGAQAPFYCGRKVSFTIYFSSYVYCADVTGFMLSLVLNLLTLCKLANLYAKRKNRYEVRRQLKRIRYMIVISLMSTLFVALPNGISLMSAWVGRIDIYFSEPAVWMIAFKSSINLFVYLLLKTEFRQRVYELLGCLNIEDQKRERIFDVSMFRSFAQPLAVSSNVAGTRNAASSESRRMSSVSTLATTRPSPSGGRAVTAAAVLTRVITRQQSTTAAEKEEAKEENNNRSAENNTTPQHSNGIVIAGNGNARFLLPSRT